MENINELVKLAGLTESKKAKPDYIDLDKDGNRKEPMKKAAQDRELEEGIFNSNRKSSKWKPGEEPAYRRKDRGEKFDLGDYGIDEPEGRGPNPDTGAKPEDVPAYIRKKQGQNFPAKIQESEQLAECGMSGDSMGPMAQEMEKSQGRLSLSSNFDSDTGRKSLTVTAEGEQAEELAQLLKLSGMLQGGEKHSQEMYEAYANEPKPKMMSLDQMLNSGDDLHKVKKSYPKAEDGDNPRAVKKESAIKEALEQRLWAEFQKEKAR